VGAEVLGGDGSSSVLLVWVLRFAPLASAFAGAGSGSGRSKRLSAGARA
jgi:hypothetical protein